MCNDDEDDEENDAMQSIKPNLGCLSAPTDLPLISPTCHLYSHRHHLHHHLAWLTNYDEGGRGVRQMLTIADKGGGGSEIPLIWLT